MSRKSVEALLLPSPTEVIDRQDAPYDLTDEEADEWHAMVSSMPASHFSRCNMGMLAQYCRHTIAARRVHHLIELCASEKDMSRSTFLELLAAQRAESNAISNLLRSMRLTQQSIYRGEVVAVRPLKNSTIPNPWDRKRKNEITKAEAAREKA